jgi:hypothetical protein
LREERRLTVFEDCLVRNIFGPERDEITGNWRKVHIEELHDLYSSTGIIWGDQIKKNDMGEACDTYGGEER